MTPTDQKLIETVEKAQLSDLQPNTHKVSDKFDVREKKMSPTNKVSAFHKSVGNSRILIVDDSASMRELLSLTLKSFGFRQIVAVKGCDEGFEQFLAKQFDLAIIDWRLNGPSGLALTRKIRTELLEPARKTPIIMCTAYTEHSKVLAAREAGINEMLRKPVQPYVLLSKVYAALNTTQEFMFSDNTVWD